MAAGKFGLLFESVWIFLRGFKRKDEETGEFLPWEKRRRSQWAKTAAINC